MNYVECPYCGEMNAVGQAWCDDCQAPLVEDGQERPRYMDEATGEKARRFLADFLEFLWYAAPPINIDITAIDIPEFLANLRAPRIDVAALTGAKGVAHLDLPKPDLSNIKAPDIDLSSVNMPDVDVTALGNLLANIELPDVDVAALGDLLASVDLPDVDWAALGELFGAIDLSDVDLSPLLDMLGDIDLG